MDDYLSKTVQQQRNRYDSNKINKYLDSENLFEVNFVTLHSLDIGIVVHSSGNVDMQHCTVRTKDSWLITKCQNLLPRRFTMLWHLCQSTLSKPHQIQWAWIHFCCSSNWLLWGTDVLKYEICVDPPALFEATGTVLQSDIPSQANAIQGWVHPSSTQIPQDDSYIYNGNALIQKTSMENRAD